MVHKIIRFHSRRVLIQKTAEFEHFSKHSLNILKIFNITLDKYNNSTYIIYK